jgi:predicted acylesterase/phospholipase RssA
MAVKTRIAFQGGGARLADLLPVVAAIQRAVDTKEIKVTYVSGTSAGSIAAAMIATGTNARQFVTQITNKRKKVISGLLGWRVSRWLRTSKAGILSAVLTGRPISSKKVLKETLLSLFSQANPKIKRDMILADLPIKGFSVTVTNITTCKGQPYTKDEDGDAKLFEVIADSCAVPFFFKSLSDLKEKPPDCFVDGGIIQNFPIDSLLGSRSTVSDMILGFGFSEDFDAAPLNRSWDYAGRLLSASMQSSMEYAKRKVGEDRVYEIRSSLDTFEFEKGIDQALDARHFEEKTQEAYDWILKKVATYRTSYERVTLSHVLGRVRDVYNSYVSDEATHDRSNLLRVIKIDSAFDESDERHSPSDRSYTMYDLTFEDSRINAIRIANPLDNLKYTFNESLFAVPEPRIVLREGGEDIEFTSIPAQGITCPDQLDHIVFLRGREAGSRTISVQQKAFIFNGLTGLRPELGATDYCVIRNQGLDDIEVATMIFYIPKEMEVGNRRHEISPEDVSLTLRQEAARTEEVFAGPGRRLTSDEIAAAQLAKEEGDSRFIRVGWRISSLPRNSVFGLNIALPDRLRATETP